MSGQGPDCVLCRGREGDAELRCVEVWEDDLWRMTMSLESEVPGFAYLEPKRHITDITRLDGPEAASFGFVLARVTAALREELGVERVYIYVFGDGVAHLHLHLAPHRPDDALNTQLIRGEVVTTQLPSGGTLIASRDYPALPESELRVVAERVRERLIQR